MYNLCKIERLHHIHIMNARIKFQQRCGMHNMVPFIKCLYLSLYIAWNAY